MRITDQKLNKVGAIFNGGKLLDKIREMYIKIGLYSQ
jgi:hypothetical protein